MRAHDEKCGVAENFCVIYLILFHQFEIIAEKETHTNKNIFRFYLLSFNLIRSATFFRFIVVIFWPLRSFIFTIERKAGQ